MRKKLYIAYQIFVGLIYIGLLAGFIYLSLQTGDRSAQQSNQVASAVASVVGSATGKPVEVTPSFRLSIRKWIGHFGYFAAIGLVSWMFYVSFRRVRYSRRLLLHFLSGFLFAFFTEFVLQMTAEGRTSSMMDVLIDFGGFLTLSLVLTVADIVRRKKRPESVNPSFNDAE